MNRTRTPRRLRTPSRPNLEALESRQLLTFYVVNSAADIANPAAGVITLRSAVEAANASASVNTIVIPTAGTYDLTGGGLTITSDSNLTIENTSGGTVTIDAGGQHADFLIEPQVDTEAVTDTFIGLTITDGNAAGLDAGGGILVEEVASLTLNQCVVTGNFADEGGGIGLDGTGTLTLNGTQVVDNAAAELGGGIVSLETGVVNVGGQSLIAGNTAGQSQGGGGINMHEGKLTVTGSVIRDNRALDGFGGGIAATGGAVAISGSLIEDNFSAQGGGGYYANSASGATITDSFFLGNAAVGDGGGLSGVKGLIQITNTTFANNAAAGSGGGAGFLNAGDPAISNSTFVGNVADAYGGGISDVNVGELDLSNSTVQGNRALVNGGGLWAMTSGDVSIDSDLFLGDYAVGSGGALDMTNSTGSLEIFDSRFSGNAADEGGALYLDPSSFSLDGNTFDSNRAAVGGAMFVDLVSNNNGLTDDTITANMAGLEGGGINLSTGSGAVALVDDTIDGNSTFSTGGGGGVFQDSSNTVNAEGTIFAGNTSDSLPSDYEYVVGTLNDKGGNLIGNATGDGSKFGPSTVFDDPKLGPLVDNGGIRAGAPSTSQVIPTQALLPGSPAIGTGPAGTGVFQDERGFNRPSTKPSIGAYEPQYASNASPNQVFVENLYEVLLDRAADPGGLAAGTGFLNGGGSPTALAQILLSSTEYLDDEATLLYQRYLGRTPSASETNTVAGVLKAGTTPEQLAAVLVGSPEFFQDYGSNDDVFVQAAYATVLGRAAGPEEAAGWDQVLAGGASRNAVAALFLSSQEYLTDLCVLDFEAYIGREPSPSDLANYLGASKAGVSSQALAAIALGGSYAART